MQLAKLYMKSGSVIEIECDNFEVVTSGEELENINFYNIVGDEKLMFVDLKNIECVTTQKIINESKK